MVKENGTGTLEAQVAELLLKAEPLFEGDASYAKVIDRVKALEASYGDLSGIDFKKVATAVDALKAQQETMVKAIRTSKRGLHMAGLEDVQDFNLLRAAIGIKTGKFGYGPEKEVIDQIHKKYEAELIELKGQKMSQDDMGGSFIPDQVIANVIGPIYTRSVFVSLAGEEGVTSISVLDGLSGGNVKVPKFDGGMIAYWIGEEDQYVESKVKTGDMTLNPKKLGVIAKITESMRQFQGYGFDAMFKKDFIRAAAKKLDWTIANGTGTDNMPRGILKHRGIKVYSAENKTVYSVASAELQSPWLGGELPFDGLQNMTLALEEDDIVIDPSHKWISGPRYFHRLRQSKVDNYSGQTTNQPYLLFPMLPDARLKDVIGPFEKSTQIVSNGLPGSSMGLPTNSVTAKFTTVIGGNLNDIVLGRWGGIEVETDEGKGTHFSSDGILIKLRLYADVGIRQERSIIVCPDARAID